MPLSERPLTIAIAGTVCLGWTPFGTRQGLAHSSTESWLLWIHEMRMQGFDIIFHENSSEFPVELFEKGLGKGKYLIITIVLGPDVIGWPVRRTRRFSAAIRIGALVWIGAAARAEVRKLFMQIFGKRVVTDAAFFSDLDDEIAVVGERLAWAQAVGASLNPDPSQQALEHFFKTSKTKARVSAYRLAVPRKAGSSGGMAADISQDPRQRFRGGAMLPSLTRSSDLVCFRDAEDLAGHIYTQKELAFSQGSRGHAWG